MIAPFGSAVVVEPVVARLRGVVPVRRFRFAGPARPGVVVPDDDGFTRVVRFDPGEEPRALAVGERFLEGLDADGAAELPGRATC